MDESKKRVPHLPWMRNPVDIDLFDERPLSLLPHLDRRLEVALRKMNIESLFPVQVAVWQETIGPGAFERDICVNSPTGSGKTLSYALPIVQALASRKIRCLRALVVLPTRDLALQVKEVFDAIAPAVGLRVGSAVGQTSIADEISELIQRPNLEIHATLDPEYIQMEPQTSVDILVATPGRLMDHINMTKDRLLREAYQSWLPTVIQLTCSTDQEMLSHETVDPAFLGSLITICNSKLKPLYLVALLQELKGEKCIVFTSSVESTHRLSTLLKFLGELPFQFSEYSRLQRQSVRSKTLKAFREGKLEVLIATDAMTRGMDVEGIRNVINYDMPPYVKTYIHRAGRTARAGQSGRCFTLLRKHEVKRFDSMLKKADDNSCTLHSLPADSIESLLPIYSSALEKLKEFVESEARRKSSIGFKSAKANKRKRTTHKVDNRDIYSCNTQE
ncbi:DEAD-box ATP-dependent RNA helicase 1 [Ananas comosus]|uniref:ATP-dependent RNA helicase n=1 Tax=Ananas comosus TaxID=4615 RepID=A0A199UXI5_ANACO|nr:DEAD-box ATP-dependent RNA helicase 1 [Ananas comosus]